MDSLAYVRIEVGGIQRFICRTGKLKEMIGGSEIINALAGSFYEKLRASSGLMPVNIPEAGQDWVVEVQRNAGILCLVLPSQQRARGFLRAFSMAVLGQFPGLPFLGTQQPMQWTVESYTHARAEADQEINRLRAIRPLPCGMPTLPVVALAALDGLPAVPCDDSQRISMVSRTQRHKPMREQSRKRLQAMVAPTEGITLDWKEDLIEMVGDEKNTVALIRMDGNDLGKCFSRALEEMEGMDLTQGMEHICALSHLVEKANIEAFKTAMGRVLAYEKDKVDKSHAPLTTPAPLTAPLRPLVMGGDDITVIIRADLALTFVHHFVRTFEQVTADGQRPLSLGVGMVVMPVSYPFAKAFTLADSLLESAKSATLNMKPRPSSLDYQVLTEEVETDVHSVRARVGTTSEGGHLLTSKPLLLQNSGLADFLKDGSDVLNTLPRGALHTAMIMCRNGKEAAKAPWLNMLENVVRRMGGRKDRTLMSEARFRELFPEGYFLERGCQWYTPLGDYLELNRLLPEGASVHQLLEDMPKPEVPHV